MENKPAEMFFGRRTGKAFAAYRRFIEEVRQGKRAMVIGPGYVVLSKAAYEALAAKANLHDGYPE